ncbi:hypothetical protein LguiA_034999 [Lonicera macranthoides]
MVLSNKKLKQKIRANLAESLAESESQNTPTIKDSTEADPPNSQTHHSLKSLLDSAIHKPRLSKREKKRTEKDSSILNTSGGVQESNQESGPEGLEEKKKRKRDGDEGEGIENGDLEKLKNKKKKMKKKSKKKTRKVGDGEVKNVVVESEGGKSGHQSVGGTTKASESQQKMDVSTKVYVGGIPYYSTEDDIRSFFEGCGSITEIDCMKFPDSGKFRGIAIISFKTEAAAKRALELDGADMGGLFLKIQLYKATREHKQSDFSPAIIDGYNRIYIGNLSWDINEEELRRLFSDCNISSIRFGEDKETGKFRGYAHVDFADSLSVTMALKLDQKIVCGRPARIRCAVPKKAATPNSQSASMGERDDNKGLTSNSKFTSTIEKDDYVESIPIPKYEEMSEKDDNGGLSFGLKYVEMSDKANNGGVSVASGKIRRRTCYECGEKGHLSSACPKKQEAEAINSGEKGRLSSLCYEKPLKMSEKGDNGGLSVGSKPVEMSEKVDNGGVSVASGKIRRRTCYECGEKGHLSSACPKKQAAEAINSGAS